MKRFCSLILLSIILPFSLLSATLRDRVEEAGVAFDESRYDEAIAQIEALLPQIPADSTDLLAEAYSVIASGYYRVGKIDLALEYGEKELAADEALGDQMSLSSALNNMAFICVSAQRYEAAEAYLDRSIEIVKQLGLDDKLAVRLGTKGEIFDLTKRHQEATPLFEEALRLDRASGNEQKVAIRLSQLGNNLMYREEFARADQYMKEAEQLHRKFQNQPSLAITLLSLGVSARSQKHFADAHRYVSESIDIARQFNLRQSLMNGYMEMSRIYRDEKDPRAYEMVLKYVGLRDSINAEQVQQQISDLEVRYETREKEQQIQMDAEIIAQQRHLYWALAALLVLAFVALLFLMRSLKLKDQNLQLRNRFDHLISHDLKNPALAQQQGLQQLCQFADVLAPADLKQALANLAQDADAQVDLLYDLLDWSSLQTGKLRYQPLRFDLESLAHEVIAQHRGQAQVKNIRLQVVPTQGQPAVVTSDRRMVASILRNALNNAIKFTPEGGEIQIQTAPHTLVVSDNGVGFDVQSQAQHQSSHTGTANERGTALGLSLSRKLAHLCHAQLLIDSKIGQGTRLKLLFQE